MNSFNGYIGMAVLGALGVAIAGAWWYAGFVRRAVLWDQSAPEYWPLTERPLVNAQECPVWHWMCKAFPGHQVNIKIPVIRFTLPLDHGKRQDLYMLLKGVYCTFTVCSPEGRVLGWADVMGRNGLPSENRQLKQALLTQCGIAYRVLQPLNLLSVAEIRSDFLGEAPRAPVPAFKNKPRTERYREFEEGLLAEAGLKLSTARHRQRSLRDSQFSSLTPYPDALARVHVFRNNAGNIDWQPNSFLAPLGDRS